MTTLKGIRAAETHDHDHGSCCGHDHGFDLSDGAALTAAERRRSGTRLVAALIAAALLVLALVIRFARPDGEEVAQVVAGLAALIVAVPTLRSAWQSLKHQDLHGVTDVLVATAMLAAWAIGDLEAAALVPLAMVIGHILEERSLIGSREAVSALAAMTKGKARRIIATGIEEVETADLRVGDRVEVRPGDRVPADAVVRDGRGSLDTAPITGESVPVEAAPGDHVHAGSINLASRLELEVLRIGADTALGKVVALMREAERAKPPVTRALERFASAWLVLVLLGAAGVFLATGSAIPAMALLVASCPCALVIAAPAAAVAGIAAAARQGILVKGTAFLEELAQVDTVILDKTGTVTLGELRVVDAATIDPAHAALAAALGAASGHPVARACATLAQDRPRLDRITETHGQGLSAERDGQRVLLGRQSFLVAEGIATGEPPAHDGPIVGLAADGRLLAWIRLADEPRPEAADALARLRALGLTRQVLITGDRAPVARAIAARMGITEVESEVLPERKLARVREEIAAGRRPLVVGDGINDALALKAGAVGVAMGARGTDAAIASADLVLPSSDLRRLATGIALSRACRKAIAWSVVIGLAWTAGIIALAAANWIGPVAAALLHNVGTLAVIANAGRLVQWREQA